LGDVDSDGDSDAVVINYQATNKVWINDGTGSFNNSGQNIGSQTGHGGALGDLDGDNDLDLFLVNNMTHDKIFLNDGSGVFSPTTQNLGNEDDYGIQVILGDIDGDDDLDALVDNYMHMNRVWINDGNGNFTDSGQSLGSDETGSMALGDIDSDDDLDVIVMQYDSFDRVWFNDGNGSFTSGQYLDSLDGWGKLDIGDLDGDNDLDLFITNSEHGNRVWLNNGTGIFNPSGQFFGDSTQYIMLGDLDGDEDLDAVTTNVLSSNSVWINDGTGSFSYSLFSDDDMECTSVSLGDVDNDGYYDVLVGNGAYYGGDGIAKLYYNEIISGINDYPINVSNMDYKLDQNYPNPFNPATKITFQIPELSFVTLKVYDVLGNEIRSLVSEEKPPGSYEIEFNASELSSGIYFYQIKGEAYIETKKMVLIK
jgi:hypothetical protein